MGATQSTEEDADRPRGVKRQRRASGEDEAAAAEASDAPSATCEAGASAGPRRRVAKPEPTAPATRRPPSFARRGESAAPSSEDDRSSDLGSDSDSPFVCPITREVFQVPVLAEDGFMYEKAALEAWILRTSAASGEIRSPTTNEPMGPWMSYPFAFYAAMRAWCAKHHHPEPASPPRYGLEAPVLTKAPTLQLPVRASRPPDMRADHPHRLLATEIRTPLRPPGHDVPAAFRWQVLVDFEEAHAAVVAQGARLSLKECLGLCRGDLLCSLAWANDMDVPVSRSDPDFVDVVHEHLQAAFRSHRTSFQPHDWNAYPVQVDAASQGRRIVKLLPRLYMVLRRRRGRSGFGVFSKNELREIAFGNDWEMPLSMRAPHEDFVRMLAMFATYRTRAVAD